MGTDETVALATNTKSGSGAGAEGEPGSAGEPRSHEPRWAIISDELSSAVEFLKQIAVMRRASVQSGANLPLYKKNLYLLFTFQSARIPRSILAFRTT